MIARRRPLRLVAGLAAAHLWYEWILTLCLMIALAAVPLATDGRWAGSHWRR